MEDNSIKNPRLQRTSWLDIQKGNIEPRQIITINYLPAYINKFHSHPEGVKIGQEFIYRRHVSNLRKLLTKVV